MPQAPLDNQSLRKRSLTKHIRALGLRSVDDYREWCNRHGFRRKLYKSRAARQWELNTFRELVIQSALRCRHRRYAADVQAPPLTDNRHQPRVPRAFERLLEIRSDRRNDLAGRQPKLHRRATLRLIRHLEAESSTLLKDERAGQYGMTYLESIATIASYHRHWIRSVEEWRSSGFSTVCQFQRLIRHLFVQYDEVPCCLEESWLMPNDRRGNKLRDLFLHLGAGRNVRRWASLPIRYSKRMAHEFMRCPDNISPLQAFRWGQLLGMGVTRNHALEVLGSRLGELYEHEEFWLTFFHWLVRHPEIPDHQLIVVIDYVHHQRFVPRLDDQDPQRLRGPEQPNLCMRRRDPETLYAQAERWDEEFSHRQPVENSEWKRSSIRAFSHFKNEQDSPRYGWITRELLTARELVDEGTAMNHCVATYTEKCLVGTSSIWTLELLRGRQRRKLLTIEIDPRQREIVQVRGRSNRDPTEFETELLQRWACSARLRLATHAW